MADRLRPITPEGFAKLQEELNDLWHGERPRIVEEVATAAAHGDRSENAEYKYGKQRLREIDRRIRYLSDLLEKSTVVRPEDVACDQVRFSATVTVEDEEGCEKCFRIVGEEEVDAKKGLISTRSPLGQALLKKRVGDEVLFRRPAGEVEWVIRKIEYG